MQPSPQQANLGQLGRYRILEVLGQGAMAVVYKAHDPQIDRTLAIKVLREEKCIDQEYRQRFLREAKAAGNLSHPNIVTIYDVGEANNRPYIVMELVEGVPLDKMMKDTSDITTNQSLDITLQLAEALDYAHKNGVVHRDIKPSNIIFPAKGNTIKITDFGIAHLENHDMTQHTQMGEVLGTPQYMSPEQVLGQAVDGRSDLFSVGVVLYQMLSGQKPFTGNTVASLLFQIATEEPKPIDNVARGSSPAIRNIVNKLLKKQPEKRFQSGQELADSLNRIIKENEEGISGRIVPIRIKWTFIMAFIVGITMVLSLIFIYQRQFEAMTQQAVDYGGSLVKFMATESAIPVLDEDWVAIEIFIQDASQRQEFKYLAVADSKGIIRGHSNPEMIGKAYEGFNGEKFISDQNGVKVYSYGQGESKIFDFDTPILFQGKEVGRIHLGLSQAPLRYVTELTLYMMLALIATTITTVMLIAYVLGKRLSYPISIIRRSLGDIGNGHLDTRITEKRQDEFGELYASFNKAAEALQHRYGKKQDF